MSGIERRDEIDVSFRASKINGDLAIQQFKEGLLKIVVMQDPTPL